MRHTLSKLCLSVFSLLALSSCKTYLTPAISGNNMGYMAKPMLSDDKNNKTYITGSYSASASPGHSVSFETGMLNIHRAHTYKSVNFSYGVFGYLGNAVYESDLIESNPDKLPYLTKFNKSISGLGLKTSVGYQIASDNGNTNFRLINWENSISKEMGSYADFRKHYHGRNTYQNSYISNKTTVWTTGLSTEIIWHARRNKDIQHAFRLFVGGSPGLVKSFDNYQDPNNFVTDIKDSNINDRIARSFNYFLKVKQFSFTYELSAQLNWANKLSLGYAF